MSAWRLWYLGIPVAAFAGAAVAGALSLPAREIIIIAFLAVGPGAAVTWLSGVRDRATWLALVVPVSLSIDLLVATALLYMGIWSPELSVGIVTVITVLAIGLVPFERGARVALIAVALLPGIVLIAAQLAASEAATTQTITRGEPVARSLIGDTY